MVNGSYLKLELLLLLLLLREEGAYPHTARMAMGRAMKLAVVNVPVVKQWSVPRCFGFSFHSYRRVSPPRRTRWEGDEVALIVGEGDGRAVVRGGKAENKNGASVTRRDVTIL